MTDQSDTSLGQRHNAARAHRLLVWLFIVCAILILGEWSVTLLARDVLKIVVCVILAGGNYLVARGARNHAPWARSASLSLACLMLLVGALFFYMRPNVQRLASDGNVIASFTGSFTVALFVVQIIGAIYILLNGNWQQPVPPDEKPDSDMRP